MHYLISVKRKFLQDWHQITVMNDNPPSNFDIQYMSRKVEKQKKRSAHKCRIVLQCFPMTWTTRVILAPRWLWNHTAPKSSCPARHCVLVCQSPSVMSETQTPSWCGCRWETDEANGVFAYAVLVSLQNSSGPTELKPAVWQKASIKIADTEICTACYNCEAPEGPFLRQVLKSMVYVKYNVRWALMENTCEYIKGRALNKWKPDSRNVFGGSSACWVSYTCTDRFIAASL